MATSLALLDERSRETADAETEIRSVESGEPQNTLLGPLFCPACQRKLRWAQRFASRAVCPHCHTHLVVLKENDGRFSVWLENEDSFNEMICDWLDEEEEEGEEEEDIQPD
jgi:uncharacterized protein YbaR (Trm112 family)